MQRIPFLAPSGGGYVQWKSHRSVSYRLFRHVLDHRLGQVFSDILERRFKHHIGFHLELAARPHVPPL